MQAKVRRPLYDGVQQIHGLWFDTALIGEAAARQRVLAHWTPGSRLHQVQGGLLLLLGVPRLAHCARIDGLPLCEQNGVLSSAPLAAEERAATPPASAWLVLGGQAHLIALTQTTRIDPSHWLALDALPLATPLKPPQLTVTQETAPSTPLPLRAVFGDKVPPASQQREQLLQQLRHGKRPAQVRNIIGNAALALGVIGLLTGASLGMLGGLAGLFGLRRSGAAATGNGSGGTTAKASKPAGLSPLARRLSQLASRIAMLSGASKVIGWRQALYLRKMLQLLEQGDTHEALRHAIPLDAGKPSDRPAFGAPRPRASLEIGANNGVTAGIGLGPELQQHLRTTYRRTFERLDREGKIDEAAYVLAELLNNAAEAVDYLERKERMHQAAQLAETLELPPATAVRLWYLAGDTERAMRLAQLTQSFEAAVRLLENGNHPQAATLRLRWAEDLAQRGALCEAADVLWPLSEQRDLALRWLLAAEESGGTLGMRALLRKLSLLPDSLADSEAAVLRLLDDDSEHGAQQRNRLATELLALPGHSSATQRIAGELLRPLLSERSAALNQLDKKTLNNLLQLAGNALLQADLPQLHTPHKSAATVVALAARKEAVQVDIAERGLLPMHDARRLPDGDYLLALGEGGVLRVDRHGKTVAQFPVPATHLVMATSGQRALALVQRNQMLRVSRIDLVTRRVSDWLVQPLRLWAPQYDGLMWNVVIDNRLLALDTSKDQLCASWQIADLPGEISALDDDGKLQALLLHEHDSLQQWRYQLPARRLIQRDIFPYPHDVWRLLPVAAHDVPLALYLLAGGGPTAQLQVRLGNGTAPVSLPLKTEFSAPRVSMHDWLLLVQEEDETGKSYARVLNLRTREIVAQLTLDDAAHAQMHHSDNHILLFDQAGRLVDISCEDSAVHTLILS